MQKEHINRYIPIIILLVLVTLAIFIIRDYLVAIIGAFIVAYLIYPIHKRLSKKMPEKTAAGLTLAGLLIIILLPIILIIKGIINQIYQAVQSGAITKFISVIENWGLIEKYNINIEELTNNSVNLGIKLLSTITISVATSIISLLVMIFIIYYLLINWKVLNAKVRNYIPFQNKEKLISEMAESTTKIVHGTLFIALLEAIAAAIGFWLAGIDFFLILAALVALFAFIPGGPGIIWVPALIVKLVQASYLDAVIILVFGLFISMYLDTILKTQITGKNSKINPVIMLLGVLGATPIMGLAGIVVGPLLLSYALEILEEVLNQNKN